MQVLVLHEAVWGVQWLPRLHCQTVLVRLNCQSAFVKKANKGAGKFVLPWGDKGGEEPGAISSSSWICKIQGQPADKRRLGRAVFVFIRHTESVQYCSYPILPCCKIINEQLPPHSHTYTHTCTDLSCGCWTLCSSTGKLEVPNQTTGLASQCWAVVISAN